MYQGNYDSGAVAKTERVESVVESQISQLSKATSELNALADDLQNRLTSVLRSQPEGKDSLTGTPIEPLTALPSAIREQKESVNRAIYTLKSILSRLEI